MVDANIDCKLQRLIKEDPLLGSLCSAANAGNKVYGGGRRRLFVLDPAMAKDLFSRPEGRLVDESDFFLAGAAGAGLRDAEKRVSSDFRQLVAASWRQVDVEAHFDAATCAAVWPDRGRRAMADIFSSAICSPERPIAFRREVMALVDGRILDRTRRPFDRLQAPLRRARLARALRLEMGRDTCAADLVQSCFDHLAEFGLPHVLRAFAAALFSTVNSLGVSLAWTLLLASDPGRSAKGSRELVLESLRLFPLSWNLEKRVAQDFLIEGREMRRGDSIAISPFACQRNGAYLERPNEFVPERWLRRDPADVMLPFGFGAHQCPAMNINLTILAEASAACLAHGYRPCLSGSRLMPGAALTPPDFEMVPAVA